MDSLVFAVVALINSVVGFLAVVAVGMVVVVLLQVGIAVVAPALALGVGCVGAFAPIPVNPYLRFLRLLMQLPNLELANMPICLAWANSFPSPSPDSCHQDPVPDQYPVVCRTRLELFL